ncbi:MAG: hypothetical protein K2X93_13480 [Candidatus Obscuribacterales bacterium]|nr:hypothetical protein [Candidatus Obscuribacterales bacterium]
MIIKKTALTLSLLALVAATIAPPALASTGYANSQAVKGKFKSSTQKTNRQTLSGGSNGFTRNQQLPLVKMTGLGGLAGIYGPLGRNGLPDTRMDSFVNQAGGMKNQIYGDEGSNGKPPFEGFDASHRIERGINGGRRQGLTTGHGSRMPAAWGGDEFCKGTEWSNSGSSGGGTVWALQPTVGINPGGRSPGEVYIPDTNTNDEPQAPLGNIDEFGRFRTPLTPGSTDRGPDRDNRRDRGGYDTSGF